VHLDEAVGRFRRHGPVGLGSPGDEIGLRERLEWRVGGDQLPVEPDDVRARVERRVRVERAAGIRLR
jgi:hypothetical protein